MTTNAFAQYNEEYAFTDIPDYLGTNVIPLTDKERRALKLSDSWARKGIDPFLVANGKLVYTHGASLATIIASPMQVCDVELQGGEIVNEIIIGDSARWLIEKGQSANVTHLFIKPIDAGLETSAVVTTNRRTYHFRLISSRTDFTPYIGFIYHDDIIAYSSDKQAREEREKHFSSTVANGQEFDLSELNFNYTMKGSYSWKPTRIYDDNTRTYIKFSEKAKSEMPVLLTRKNNQDAIVNYRVKENVMIADGIFEEIRLVIGVGSDKQEIRIVRD